MKKNRLTSTYYSLTRNINTNICASNNFDCIEPSPFPNCEYEYEISINLPGVTFGEGGPYMGFEHTQVLLGDEQPSDYDSYDENSGLCALNQLSSADERRSSTPTALLNNVYNFKTIIASDNLLHIYVPGNPTPITPANSCYTLHEPSNPSNRFHISGVIASISANVSNPNIMPETITLTLNNIPKIFGYVIDTNTYFSATDFGCGTQVEYFARLGGSGMSFQGEMLIQDGIVILTKTSSSNNAWTYSGIINRSIYTEGENNICNGTLPISITIECATMPLVPSPTPSPSPPL
jgi:hypothetical protein